MFGYRSFLILMSSVVIIAGCERPDHRGVSFRPPEETEWNTVVNVHVAAKSDSSSDGVSSWQLRSPLGAAWTEVTTGRIVVDNRLGHPVDERGRVRIEGLAPGWYDFAYEQDGQEAAPLDRIVVRWPVQVIRNEMTLVLLEVECVEVIGTTRVWSQRLAPAVIIKPHLRDLVQRAAVVDEWLSAFLSFLGGTLAPDSWTSLFCSSARDPSGDIVSMLRAHRYRRAVAGQERVELRHVVTFFEDDRAEVVLAASQGDGMGTRFHRIVLGRHSDGPGGLRALSLGVDPRVGEL